MKIVFLSGVVCWSVAAFISFVARDGSTARECLTLAILCILVVEATS